MADLISSYESQNIGTYEKHFDQGSFRFHFSPVDLNAEDPPPEFWTWTDERLTTANMFTHPNLEKIELDQ